jgi:hypothetical protein
MFNGQSCSANVQVTVAWDTLEWDDVGAWRSDNPSKLITPPGFNAIRIKVHTCWAAPNNSFNRYCRLVQTWNFSTTPSTVYLAEYGKSEGAAIGSMGDYWDSCSFWPTSPGNQIYLQVLSPNTIANPTTFSPSGGGAGPAWLQAEWAFAYAQTDTQNN